MSFTKKFVHIYKALLPSPFGIAIVLSFFTVILGVLFGETPNDTSPLLAIAQYWEQGIWNGPLLVFAIQMMLMLVLGHILALSKPFTKFISVFVVHLNTTAKAAAFVTLTTMLVAFFNWGLGLIFGAILARKVADQAMDKGWKLNYPLIGAAGYSGLMVWHGGFSGSSIIKVAEPGHLTSLFPDKAIQGIPEAIDFSQTLFSSMNLTISLALLILLPTAMYLLGKRVQSEPIPPDSQYIESEIEEEPKGADRVDHSNIVGYGTGALIVGYVLYKMFFITGFFQFFTPNNINLLLLGMGILFHQNLHSFAHALDDAIGGAAGILIQFPLYFGILGILRDSGLISQFAMFVSTHASPMSFTYFTFFSSGVVNILVPSGGGQWAIQGPLIVQTAMELNAPLAKNIMAFAYGDQITNMLQPFWALPLLGITGLKAKQILPYTLFLLAIALPIFLIGLWLF